VVKAAKESPGQLLYETFNICDKLTHKEIDVKDFLSREYKGVPVKCDLSGKPSLLSSANA